MNFLRLFCGPGDLFEVVLWAKGPDTFFKCLRSFCGLEGC